MPNRPVRKRGAHRANPVVSRGVARGALLALVAMICLVAGVGAWFGHVPASGDPWSAMAHGRYERAARWLAADAESGDPIARTALGNLYYLGLGVARDTRRAAELYHAAASDGHPPAQMNLGHLYSQGIGVPSDAVRAFGWYHHADLADDPAAEHYLYQISVEYTISPLQRSTAVERWRTLDDLIAEGL